MSTEHSDSSALIGLQTQLFQATRKGERPHPTVMPWVLDRRNLEAAWERVSGNPGANTPGVDGKTCADIGPRIVSWLNDLARQLLEETYRAAVPRWVDVPKHPGSTDTRRLGILTVRDRVVHAALKQVLEPLFEPQFLDCSFGFRPGRSVPAALATAVHRLSEVLPDQPPFTVAAHLDIADCFDSIDHELLRQALVRQIDDPKCLGLIDAILAQSGETRVRFFRRSRQGLIQGSAASPLLCNLFLHPIDESLEALAQSTQQRVIGFRYADDLLLAGRDERSLHAAIRDLGSQIGRLKLRWRSLAGAIRPLEQGVDWLGVTLRRRTRPWDGKLVYRYEVPAKKVMHVLDTISEMTQVPSDRIGADAFNLSRWIVSLNDQLRQWREAYVFAENGSEVFAAVDEHARRCVGNLIRQLTGLKGRSIFDRHYLRLPRAFWTWQVDGTRLVCLSSLAPRAPERLIRRPVWQRSRRGGAPAASRFKKRTPPIESNGDDEASEVA